MLDGSTYLRRKHPSTPPSHFLFQEGLASPPPAPPMPLFARLHHIFDWDAPPPNLHHALGMAVADLEEMPLQGSALRSAAMRSSDSIGSLGVLFDALDLKQVCTSIPALPTHLLSYFTSPSLPVASSGECKLPS